MNINIVKNILEKYDTTAKKQYGQNFLLDDNVISKICYLSNINKDTDVIEIGPGLGFLTEKIAAAANKVLCYEIDEMMIKVLEDKFNNQNVIIKHEDFLKINIDDDICKYLEKERVILISNLPYYITTPILLKILEESKKISQLTVMMQEEVALRICGKPSTKDYNALSVLLQYYTNPKTIINVKASSFYPAPNVDSSVVKITYKETKDIYAVCEEYFKKFNRAAFTMRRKTLVNNLKTALGYNRETIEEVLKKNNIDINVRSEALSVNQIVILSNDFYNLLYTK
jgi:16S rRNA (adenine1518-N6/adenine1519-N6)-dimethyltransferase